jgi:NADP-dependent 3-hydroxy acid dehydrogenase YdfG
MFLEGGCNMAGIDGKVIAITGASSGIGRAAALLLAGRGATVVLGARRIDELEAVVRDIERAGGVASHRRTDVAKREDVAALTALASDRHGKLDVLISNAGIGPISKLDELRVEDWEAMVDINVKGLLYGIAAALPIFRRQGFGHFVNTISTAGIQISPTMAVYAATKNAVRTLSEGLRLESDGQYRVTGISPGFVGTNFAGSMTDPGVRAGIQKQMDEIALEPEAIARAMAFAIEQPDHVDVGDIVVRPTVQN